MCIVALLVSPADTLESSHRWGKSQNSLVDEQPSFVALDRWKRELRSSERIDSRGDVWESRHPSYLRKGKKSNGCEPSSETATEDSSSMRFTTISKVWREYIWSRRFAARITLGTALWAMCGNYISAGKRDRRTERMLRIFLKLRYMHIYDMQYTI